MCEEHISYDNANRSVYDNGMLHHSFGEAVIFLSLQHFIAPFVVLVREGLGVW